MTDAQERWLPVLGFEGYYEVSDLGRVRSVDREIQNRRGHMVRRRGKLLAGSFAPDGRRSVILNRNRNGIPRTVSTLVLEAFVGPRPEGHECCHSDGDASNDRLSNLRWGTRSENVHDKVRHGMHPFASRVECPGGHRLVEPNLRASHLREGRRGCLACSRATALRQTAVARGEPFDFKAVADAIYVSIMGPSVLP